MKTLAIALVLCGVATFAVADEAAVKLKAGSNVELVSGSCLPCHSLDYIPMNSVFQDRKGWEATVNKMIKVMGAKIAQDDVSKIVDYLTQAYGRT